MSTGSETSTYDYSSDEEYNIDNEFYRGPACPWPQTALPEPAALQEPPAALEEPPVALPMPRPPPQWLAREVFSSGPAGSARAKLVCSYLGPRDLAVFANSCSAMKHIAMADALWKQLTTRAFPTSGSLLYSQLPDGAAKFAFFWQAYLRGGMPARRCLFQDTGLRRIEERRGRHHASKTNFPKDWVYSRRGPVP